jgi:pimeloyl-ACP methyl ester carboxylesterase
VPIEKINGVNLFVEDFGSGDPLVLVHGSWVDHMEWPFVVPQLAPRFRVTIYDRRGHSQSERLETRGSIHEDVADLAAIIERAGAPAHVHGSSFGGSISLRLAAERPELVRTLSVHEPPLFDLIIDDPQYRETIGRLNEEVLIAADEISAGELENGARRFVEHVALGPGSWDNFMPDEVKRLFINNAPTFLDECQDRDAGFGRFPPTSEAFLEKLADFERPIMLSGGSDSPPVFAPVLDKLQAMLPNATRTTFAGAGHIPHFTHAQDYVAKITEFIDSTA